MTREEKIDAFVKEIYGAGADESDDIRAGILAGIRLRDEELLAMEFEENAAIKQGFVFSAMRPAFLFKDQVSERYFAENNALEIAMDLARWQFEQFIKAIKGE